MCQLEPSTSATPWSSKRLLPLRTSTEEVLPGGVELVVVLLPPLPLLVPEAVVRDLVVVVVGERQGQAQAVRGM